MTQATPVVPAKTMYLNNKELLIAVKESKEQGKMSTKLAHMLQLLCSKYATKGSFVNYSYNEDMQAYAMMMLVRTWNSFDPSKSTNPFAFFTQCIKNSFIQYLNHEKRQRTIRDLLLVDIGLNPSFGFEENASDQHYVEDEQDYYYHKETAQALQQHITQEDELFKEETGQDRIAPEDVLESEIESDDDSTPDIDD